MENTTLETRPRRLRPSDTWFCQCYYPSFIRLSPEDTSKPTFCSLFNDQLSTCDSITFRSFYTYLQGSKLGERGGTVSPHLLYSVCVVSPPGRLILFKRRDIR